MNDQLAVFLTTVPHIVVRCQEQLETTYAFAQRTQRVELLETEIKHLNTWGEGRHQAEVYLYPDFSPFSFYFEVYPKGAKLGLGNRLMNGGLIYHGALEDGSHPNTFTVSLTPQRAWSVHT